MLGQIRSAQTFDHGLEKRGGDCEVVRRPPCVSQLLFYRRERARVFVIPAHIPEQGQKTVESTLVIDPARSFDAVGHAFVQTIETPLGEGDADYRDLEYIIFHHGIERREEHQSVRTGGCPHARPSLAAPFSPWPPNCSDWSLEFPCVDQDASGIRAWRRASSCACANWSLS